MSQENPFQSPSVTKTAATPKLDRGHVKTIATRQRVLLLCMVGYVVAGVTSRIGSVEIRPAAQVIWAVFVLAAAVIVFLLASSIFSTGLGVLLGVLTLVPLLGLLILAIVNGKATNILRQNGIKVGFLGANLSQF